MERPSISNEFGDVGLYTVARPLAPDCLERVQTVLQELDEITKVATVDIRPLGSTVSWLPPRETRGIYRELIAGDKRTQQRDATPFNDIIFARAERIERKRPTLEIDFGPLEIFGSIAQGRDRGSQFVILPLVGTNAVELVNERNETVNQLARPHNACLSAYQRGVRPHLSLLLTDKVKTAKLLKKDLKKIVVRSLTGLAFSAPELDSTPYFSNPREYQKYLRTRRQKTRAQRETQLAIAKAA